MDLEEGISAREAITRLIFAYCSSIDSGRLDDTARLFSDGTWRPGLRSFTGFDEMHEFLSENVLLHDGVTGTRHTISNLRIDIADDGRTARSDCYVIVYQSVDGSAPHIIFQGAYEDSFSRVDEQWRFAERKIIADGFGDMSRHMRSAS